MLGSVRGIGDNGVAVVGIVVVAGVAVRVHLEEIVVVVRVGRTLPPIVVVSTKRSGTGNGLVDARENVITRPVICHLTVEILVLASLLIQRLEPTIGLPTIV